MPLTEIEEARLQKYIDDLHITPEQQSRIHKIAEMSKDGASYRDIHAEVRGCGETLYRRRTQLRRRQVY